MRSSRFSDEQIIAILREQEAGRPTGEVCRAGRPTRSFAGALHQARRKNDE